MMLSITTRTKHGHKRHFTAYVNTLEIGLEAVNEIATTGDTLLRVHILERNDKIALPVEAFDGRPLLAPIQALEEEYKQILRQLPLSSVNQADKLLALIIRQLDRHEAYMARLQTAIIGLQKQLLLAEETFVYNQQQLSQLNTNLERYQRFLATAIKRKACLEAEIRMITW